MSFKRGKFGVEYDSARRDGGDRHLLTWAVGAVAVLAVVSVITARGCVKRVKIPSIIPPPVTTTSELTRPPAEDPPSPSETPAASTVAENPPPPATSEKPPSDTMTEALPEPARLVRKWIGNSAGRPAVERTLLEKLLEAERAYNAKLALDTIERLRQRPAMADLDGPLARRLGTLNLQWLLSSRPSPWTTVAVTRRGDTYHRIAREHGTTLAAVLKLNNVKPDAKPEPGSRLRVLEFPRAAIVVHVQTKLADVSLNGKFFKRYYASTGPGTKVGSYPVTREAGPRTRFKELSIVFTPSDLDEIAMLLPPGASIAVARP